MVDGCEAMSEQLSVLRSTREVFDERDRAHVVKGDGANVAKLGDGGEMEIVW